MKKLKSFASDKELVIFALNTVKDSKDPQSLICSDSKSMSEQSLAQATGNLR